MFIESRLRNLGNTIEGEFKKAGNYFRSQIDKNNPDPALLYNLGTCLCNQGDLAGALVCFERALLLKPYDSAIRENLNFVRRNLFLPESGTMNSPSEMLVAICQDLRPDEWLLIAFAAWALAGIVGPQIISYLKDTTGSYQEALYYLIGFLFLGLTSSVLLILNTKKLRKKQEEQSELKMAA